jgi:hypothetical protein
MPIFIIAIALLVLACGQQPAASPQPSLGEQVPLLTGRVVGKEDAGCYLNFMVGILNTDETYGTKMAGGEDWPQTPIMWPVGYTGYRVGSEIAVVDEFGHVVGITGQYYAIDMGAANNDVVEPNVPGTWLTCGPPRPYPSASPT